jgi:heme A synthase
MRACAALVLAAAVLVLGAVFGAGTAAQPGGGTPGRTVYAWFPRDFGNWDTRALETSLNSGIDTTRLVAYTICGVKRTPPGLREELSSSRPRTT